MKVTKRNGGPCPRRSDRTAWCGFCYANLVGRSSYKGHSHYRAMALPLPYWRLSCMKRPAVVSPPLKGKWSCPDKSFGTRYPLIAEMLCDPVWEDGKSRELASLTVRFDGISCLLSISDHALQCSAYTTAATVEEALQSLQDALKAGTLTFRPWKTGKK